MKNHELLDMIGEANEDYVQAADADAARPRFRWKALAACAACAVLAVAAYPFSQVFWPQESAPDPEATQGPGLHSYTLMDEVGGSILTHQEQVKSPASGAAAVPEPSMPICQAPGEDAGGDIDGSHYDTPGRDVPVDQEPYDQYNSLYENARLDQYPEWYGGAYIDHNALGEPSRLVVCIVDGFHTPELEQQIAAWCGEGVWTYRDVKYSRGYLQTLMERLNSSEFLDFIDPDGAALAWGVYEQDNCIKMEWRAIPSDAALAELAKLDPGGDAIQVQVSAQSYTTADELVKAPASNSAAQPVPGGAQAEPSRDGQDVPAEASLPPAFRPEEPPAVRENSMPALTENG